MTDIEPCRFAQAWASAWNARDVEAVLAHFHDDAVFSSPIARSIGHGVDGVVVGKPAIREYWTVALEHNPDLHFTIRAVHAGVQAIVIVFATQDGIERAEILMFEGGLVKMGFGTMPAVRL